MQIEIWDISKQEVIFATHPQACPTQECCRAWILIKL